MYHMIEFHATSTGEIARQGFSNQMEGLRVQRLTRALVRLHPHVVEIKGELVEVADLQFEDGTVAAQIPYAQFHFLD